MKSAGEAQTGTGAITDEMIESATATDIVALVNEELAEGSMGTFEDDALLPHLKRVMIEFGATRAASWRGREQREREPVAIVGMSAGIRVVKLAAGVVGSLVASGAMRSGSFPQDRGWDWRFVSTLIPTVLGTS